MELIKAHSFNQCPSLNLLDVAEMGGRLVNNQISPWSCCEDESEPLCQNKGGEPDGFLSNDNYRQDVKN